MVFETTEYRTLSYYLNFFSINISVHLKNMENYNNGNW